MGHKHAEEHGSEVVSHGKEKAGKDMWSGGTGILAGKHYRAFTGYLGKFRDCPLLK